MLINEFLILPLAFVFFNVSPASGDNYFTNNLSEKNNKINPVSIKYEEPASRGRARSRTFFERY